MVDPTDGSQDTASPGEILGASSCGGLTSVRPDFQYSLGARWICRRIHP